MPLTRRQFVRASAGLAAAAATAAHGAPRRPPNVLLIMTDQQPVATLGCYGNPLAPTPHLDALAAQAVRFSRFYIAGFPCSPSRASLLSGRYPHSHGVTRNDVLFDPAVPCLGDLLRDAGYTTGYVGKWHLGGNMYRNLTSRTPFDGRWYYRAVPDAEQFRFEQVEGGPGEDAPQHGFDFWRGGWEHYHEYLREVGLGDLLARNPGVGNHNDLPDRPEGQHMVSQLPEQHHMAAFFAREACGFLRQQRRARRPFGLVLSFFGPHTPVAPPRPWDDRYALDDASLPPNLTDLLSGKPVRQQQNGRCYVLPRWNEQQFRDYVRRYYGYCAYLDAQIGRVLTELTESGLADDTVVVFTSDHGDMMAGHGMVFKLGHCGYEELMRVPLIVRAPGQARTDAACHALVSQVDVLPTILALLGVPTPGDMQGRSFAGLLRRPGREHRQFTVTDSSESGFTLCERRWKYVLNLRPRDADELYDLESDPAELRNLASDDGHAAVIRRLRARFVTWLERTDHPYAGVHRARILMPPELVLLDVRPEIADFRQLGPREFQMTVRWHVGDPIPGDTRYWSFTQFLNRRYGANGDIAFRFTPWPEPPTTEWQPGQAYTIGPIKVTVPDHCGPGTYEVRTGLWNPDTKQGPGALKGGAGNYRVVGTLVIEADQIRLEPAP